MSESQTQIIDAVKAKFGDQVLDEHSFRGDQTVTIKKDSIVDVCRFLRDDPNLQFDFLMDLTAVDYFKKKPERFEVVYHFYSSPNNTRFRVKTPVSEEDCITESVFSLWKTADWFEREIWDMYGIRFTNHPNLKRILLYEGFKGHPLRKDYPINKRQPLIGPVN